MTDTVQVFSNSLGQDELDAVGAVMRSHWLGKGRECDAFEREFAAHLGVERALLFNSCTSALYTAVRLLRDRYAGRGWCDVIIPSIHFVAAANAVRQYGMTPVFADVDPHTLTILPREIDRLRSRYSKAVIMLHYGGHIAPDAIWDAAAGMTVIEDAANSVSTKDARGRAAGTIGTAGVWSFDAMKELVMGDGGALWLADADLYEHAESLRYLGLRTSTTSGQAAAQAGAGRWWEYDVNGPAERHISNDLLAAIGRVQLRRLPEFIERRRQVWDTYQRELAGVGDLVLPPEPPAGSTASYYLYWVQTAKRDELARWLNANGIYSTFRYFPLHQVPYYWDGTRLPNAERVAQVTLNLPLHQNLSDGDVQRVIDYVRGYYLGA